MDTVRIHNRITCADITVCILTVMSFVGAVFLVLSEVGSI